MAELLATCLVLGVWLGAWAVARRGQLVIYGTARTPSWQLYLKFVWAWVLAANGVVVGNWQTTNWPSWLPFITGMVLVVTAMSILTTFTKNYAMSLLARGERDARSRVVRKP